MKAIRTSESRGLTMRKSITILAIMLAAIVSFMPQAKAQLGPELIKNGNMETNDPPDFWPGWNATVAATNDVPSGGGSQSLWILNNTTNSIDGEAYQTSVSMASGKKYFIEFDHKRDSATAGLYFSIAMNNDGGTFADFASISSSWGHYTNEWVVGGTTATSGQLNVYPVGGGQSIMIDNFSIKEVIPEPATVALVLSGLGVMAVLHRRKRNKSV